MIKFLFVSIWSFFIYRISSYINLSANIIQFKEKNWNNLLNDCLSIFIIIGLFTYVLIYLINSKKISYIIILIIYPVFGLIGTLTNYELHEHNSLIWHQFITLTSVILFFTIIDSNKVFNYQFKELLLKIILLCIFIFLLFFIFSKFYFVQTATENLRGGDLTKFSLFNNKIYFEQNINGLGRILFVLEIFFLFLFKKFIFTKKKTAHIFFFVAILLATTIYLIQSRFNIFASFIFAFFLLINIKNLHLKKKLLYILVIIILPIFIFNQYSKIKNRFLINQIYNETISVNGDNMTNMKEILNENLLKNIGILDEKFFGKYPKLKKNILILDNELKNIDNIDNFKNSKFLYKIILNIRNEITEIEAENKINDNLIKEYYLISQIKQLVNNYNRILFLKCQPSLNSLDGMFTGRICGWEILLKTIQINEIFFGKGYFADQLYLKNIQKTSSNSWINILFNAGIISLFVYVAFIISFFFRFFNFKNINHENLYLSISHYFSLYFVARSILEDTIAFVSIDFLMLGICLLLITESKKKVH